MYFPVVVYWCQYNWLSASLIKFLLESKFAARNAKASSSSQGPRHGNIMKLRFNSNLTANEGAPFVCHHCRLETRTFCFPDTEESWYQPHRLWLSVFKCHFILSWVENFKIQVFKWVFSNPNTSLQGSAECPYFVLERLLSKVIWFNVLPNTSQDPARRVRLNTCCRLVQWKGHFCSFGFSFHTSVCRSPPFIIVTLIPIICNKESLSLSFLGS